MKPAHGVGQSNVLRAGRTKLARGAAIGTLISGWDFATVVAEGSRRGWPGLRDRCTNERLRDKGTALAKAVWGAVGPPSPVRTPVAGFTGAGVQAPALA